MNKKFKIGNSVRYGSMSLIATAVVLAIIVIVNLAVNALPASYTTYTTDAKGVYDITDTSRDYLSKLDTDVILYVVATEAANDEHHLMIKEFIRRYSLLSDRITVKNIDPELYPEFINTYIKKELTVEYTAEDLSTEYTHLVVESEKRSMIVPYSNIFTLSITTDQLEEYYYTYGYVPYDFELENRLLSAIDFVCADTIPSIYYTTGHGEAELDSGYKGFAVYENILLNELKLSEAEGIPSEGRAIIIYAPTTDFTDAEIKMLKEFSDRGGNIILSTCYNSTLESRDLPKLYSFIAEYYGLEYFDVMVFDGNAGNYFGYQYWLFPKMTSSVNSVITSTSGSLLFRNCNAIAVSETLPEGVKVTALQTTSDSGYAKTKITESTQSKKEEGDLEGSFLLGAMSERTTEDARSVLWWYASTDALSTEIDSQLASIYGTAITKNSYLVIYTLIEAVDKDNSVSVASVALTYEILEISDGAATLWSVIIIAIIPGAILAYGIYVRYKRVRR